MHTPKILRQPSNMDGEISAFIGRKLGIDQVHCKGSSFRTNEVFLRIPPLSRCNKFYRVRTGQWPGNTPFRATAR